MLKYLQFSLSFLPLILIAVFFYLAETVPVFKYLEYALLAAGIGYVTYSYFTFQKLLKNINEEGNLPKIFADFPIYETSESEYRLIRQKMENFIVSVENDQPAEVELTAGEINCLRTKGNTPTKSGDLPSLRLPEYYKICNGKIYEYSITLAPFVSLSGFWSFAYEIKFFKEDEKLFEAQKMIEKDGRELPDDDNSIRDKRYLGGKLLTTILRLDKTMEWADSMKLVISKLQNIEVIEDKLVLRS
jgi:hypothetical protein